MRNAWPIVVLLLLLPGTRAGGQTPVVTTDLLHIRTVSSIDVSPDGSKAVLAVRSIAPDQVDQADPEARPSWSYHSHLFLLDVFDPDSAPRQLTYGERRDGGPRFSPDGRQIAFTRAGPGNAAEPDEEQTQVWLLPVDGGEARQLTTMEHGVAGGSVRWAPDGRRLLVRSSVPLDELDGAPPYPSERPQRAWNDGGDAAPRPDGTRSQIRAWLAENAAAEDPSVINRLYFQDEIELRGPMEIAHLFLIDVGDGTTTRLTNGFFDHHDGEFTADGAAVVYAANKQTGEHPDRVRGTDIWRINADGSGDQRHIWLEGWTLENPRPSRDGAFIAFTAEQLDEPAFRQRQLGVAAAEGLVGGEPVTLTGGASMDTSVRRFEWVTGRPSLLFTGGRHGGIPLLTTSLGVLEPVPVLERLGDRVAGVYAFDVGGPSTVCAVTTAGNPCVVVVRDGRGHRVAWDLNPWVASRTLSRPVEGWIDRPDGQRVQYWVMEPTKRRAGETYPLVVAMHGGPSAMWGPGERTMWHEFQLLCSWGYGVAYCNPRGSGGYGYEFQRGNYQDWGSGPAGDVLAMASKVAQLEWVDEDELVLTGGSYAGYLTAWIVAHDQRFKAAVAQRGVYDLAVFYGEGNAWRLLEWAMGGPPHDARYRQIIDRNSPQTYVSRIRTPLLIMHASQDLRTGVSQSEMLYRALKALERPVEYVRYPDAGHDLSRTGDPRQRMDRLNRIIEFFERYVDNPRPAPRGPAVPLTPAR